MTPLGEPAKPLAECLLCESQTKYLCIDCAVCLLCCDCDLDCEDDDEEEENDDDTA